MRDGTARTPFTSPARYPWSVSSLELLRRALPLALLAASLLACGDDSEPDSGAADAAAPDASAPDAGVDGGAGEERWVPPPGDAPAGPLAPFSTRCQHFVDDAGRVAILRGVNARVEGVFDVTFDDGRAPLEPIPAFTAADATRMRELGFDLLRLPINWSAVEPEDTEPPTYDDAYLARVQEVVDLCRAAGVYVILDFHQDAYSKHIGEDGAPLWAIEPPPEMLLEGPLDDLEERRTSGQVLAAFETFFGDAEPGPTLRARFAAMAAHVAEAFAGDEAVFGYETFNEPIGDFDQVARLNVLVAEAMREADPAHPILFEPPVLQRNLTDRSGLPEAPFPVSGGVYAPHIYTLAFFGSDAQRESFTRASLRRGHLSAAQEALAWGTPLLVGEWGWDPDGIRADDYYRLQQDLHDEFGASTALWLWKERSQGRWGLFEYDDASETWSERPEMIARVTRPRPERIAGWPETWRWDDEAGELSLRYAGDAAVTAPTVLYLPELPEGRWSVRCDGAPVEVSREPATGRVEVPCGGPGSHEVLAARE